MRREVIEINGPARKIAATETKLPVGERTVRASKAKPQISRTGTAAETEATVTTLLRVIRKWVEERGGQPVLVKNAAGRPEREILRIHFPGFVQEEPIRKIPWPEWFKRFEANELAFLYQEKTKDGKQSHFFQLIKR